MDVGREIAAAMSRIEEDEQRDIEQREQREKYQRSMKILRTIPSGTPDSELTPEQLQAWKDHDDAIAWLRA